MMRSCTFPAKKSPQHQQGAALLVSLVILLVLTVLALSSMQGTSTQEKMVSAQRDSQIALEGAEAALVAAEALLDMPAGTLPTFEANKGLYDELTNPPTDLLNPQTWDAPSGGGTGNGTREAPMPMILINGKAENMLAVPPRYFVKATPASAAAATNGFDVGTGGVADGAAVALDGDIYRVVAFSSGASGQAVRAIEAYILQAR